MIKKILPIMIVTVMLLGGLAASAALAAGPLDVANQNLKGALAGTGLQGGNAQALPLLIGTVVKAVLSLVGTIFLGLTIYAGILWMTAAGNEERVTKATDIIKACIIGLFITMSAYAITYFVTGRLSGTTNSSITTTTP